MPGDSAARAGTVMPRKRKKITPETARGPGQKRRQYNIAFHPEYGLRIDDTADTLGLDATQLLRMIVREHLPEYEQRAAAVKRGDKPHG